MKVLAFTKTAETKATYIDYAGQKNTISLILITSISDGNNSFAPSSANSQTNIPVAHQGEHGINKKIKKEKKKKSRMQDAEL